MQNEELIKLGYAKKFLDYWDFVPGFQNKYKKNKIETLREYGFPLTPQDFACGTNGKRIIAYDNSALWMYHDFVDENNERIGNRYKRYKYPQNEKMYRWFKKITAISKEQGIRQVEKSYYTVAFELTKGCTGECKFCGFDAPKLTSVYEATPENLALFGNCIDILMNTIGDAVRLGHLHHTSEPLDNPNYEKFSDVFYEKTGVIPQITTAFPMRDIERTRRILKQVNENKNTYHRFSLMVTEDLFRVYEAFEPEELLYTSLEPPRYSHGFVKSGRYGRLMGEYSGTISGMVGFVINMCDKSISLRYLCNASELHPTGEVNVCTVNFRDAIEFEECVLRIIENEM